MVVYNKPRECFCLVGGLFYGGIQQTSAPTISYRTATHQTILWRNAINDRTDMSY